MKSEERGERREEYAMRNDTPDGATNYSLLTTL